MPTSPAPQGRKKSYDPSFIRQAINMVETRGEAVTTSAVITAMHDRFDVPKTINQEAVKREVLSYVEDRDTQYREKAIQQLPQAVREAVNAAVAGLGKDCTTALALQYATLKDDTSSQLAMMTDEKLDMQRKVRELNAVIEASEVNTAIKDRELTDAAEARHALEMQVADLLRHNDSLREQIASLTGILKGKLAVVD